MCSNIEDVLRKFEDQDEKGKLARDSLNAMMELAGQRSDAFYTQVTNSDTDTKILPIKKILYRGYILRCNVSSGTGNVGDIIKNNYRNFASGVIADGIAEVVEEQLRILLGYFTGSTSKREFYTITSGSVGGIQRVDISLYAYQFTAKQLTEITKNVVSATVIVSSVDPYAVTEASIRGVVQNQFSAERRHEILDILLKAHKNAQQQH